jgi:hypothetical protein
LLNPEVPDPENKAAVQLMVAPVMLLLIIISVAVPEHNACVRGVVVTESTWLGVTVTLFVLVQPLEVIVSVR